MIQIFDTIELSQTEQDVVAKLLADPAVQKYFKALAHNKATQILQMYAADNQTDKFLRDVASMQGQISVLNTLSQISGT